MKRTALRAPDWLVQSAIYQINPRTFSAEGTISAVTKELPSLKALGFGILYFCPLFETDDSANPAFWSIRQKASETGNPKNPYRMNDYFKIDSEYGTADDLHLFIEEAHRLGMRVLLDLVYLHIGPNAPILRQHPEFAQQNADGSFHCTYWNFPYLDYNCMGLREYLWSNMTYFVGEFDVDGFRCDVGDDVPIDFWTEGRRRIWAIKPDAVMIVEGRNWDYLLRGFDTSYCFDWHEDLYKAFSGELTAAEIRKNDENRMTSVPAGGLLVRDIDNHDTVTDWPERTELRAGNNGMELIEVLNYLIAGIPMVYCGNELADTAKHNMFANRFFKGKFEVTDRAAAAATPQGIRRQKVMKQLNQWRSECKVLSRGEMEWLNHNQPEKLLAFRRFLNEESVVFIGNISSKRVSARLAEPLNSMEIVLSNDGSVSGEEFNLEQHGYIVLRNQ